MIFLRQNIVYPFSHSNNNHFAETKETSKKLRNETKKPDIEDYETWKMRILKTAKEAIKNGAE